MLLPPFRTVALAGVLAVLACGLAPRRTQPLLESGGWHEFQGTWTASGSRYIMRLGNDRRSSISNLEGSLLLAGTSRPAVGFRAEAIVFNDSVTGMGRQRLSDATRSVPARTADNTLLPRCVLGDRDSMDSPGDQVTPQFSKSPGTSGARNANLVSRRLRRGKFRLLPRLSGKNEFTA